MASPFATRFSWVWVLLLVLPGAAAADDPLGRGIDPLAAKPAATMSGLVTLEGGRVEAQRSLAMGVTADLADGLLVLWEGDREVGELIERRLQLHLGGAYVVADGIEVAVDLPFAVWQRHGFARFERETGIAEDAPSALGFGDARVLGKLRLLDENRAPVSLALLGEVRIPTGDEDSFLGERGWTLAPRLAAERTFGGKLCLVGEAGYRWREAPGRFLNLYVGDELTFGVGGSYALPAVGWLEQWALLAEVNAATPARSPFAAAGDALQSAVEALGGVRAGLGGCFEATLAAGAGIGADAGVGKESWRVLAGVRCTRIFHDRDGDGIEDPDDVCPDEPEDRDGFEDVEGCPDPDNDGDGVPDVVDACPDKPGLPEYDGCPDQDGDEIPDREDRCPSIKGEAKYDGCPPEGPPYVTVEGDRVELANSVRFDTGKDTVTPDSRPVLDEVARILLAHPELRLVRVEGHTDSRGSDAFNLDLSKRRARTVVRELIARGVQGWRLDSEGYGETRPIADNHTALGRAKNRRVELTIVEREKK